MFRRAKQCRAMGERRALGQRANAVDRYLASLRRRAWAQAGARALVYGLGAAAIVLTGAARFTGPVASWPVALAAFAAALAAVSAGTLWGLRGVRSVAGSGAARLLSPARAELASAARSAAELAHDEAAIARAPGLVAAHAARVQESLAKLSPATVLPWRAIMTRSLIAGGLAAPLCVAFTLADPRALAGSWALTHPASRDADGNALAAVVASCDARLVYPAYLGRDAAVLHDVTVLEAPPGTTVELTVWPRVAATRGTLDVAGRPARLARATEGGLTGRFVVREAGALSIRVREGDRWLRDPTARSLRLQRDDAPRVAITEPSSDRTIEANEDISVFWSAKDDVGIAKIDLVIKTAEGHEVRRRLDTYGIEEHRMSASGNATLSASALGAQPGDRIVLRVDARDADAVSGPNLGRSEERTLTVASDSTRHAANVAGLKDALDLTLATLADRLESPPPTDESDARARYAELGPGLPQLATALDDVAQTLRSDEAARRSDASALTEMAHRLRRAATQERQFHATRLASAVKRSELERTIVAELETDTLRLADLLGRARLEDAATIMRELEQIRRRMASLLAELRRAPDDETRRALMAEVARAEQRMRELAERLARMGTDVPSDFVYQEAMPASETQSALDGLREALERNDLEEAARRMDALSREIDRMASALGSAQEGFDEARFGPRERAMAEAMDALAGLESEQRDLAQRSSEARGRAAERAESSVGGQESATAERLAHRAGDLRRALDGLDRRRLDSSGQEVLDRARQRARDTEDALHAGDLAEASRMASEATDDAQGLARDLAMEAEMFGGTDGRSGQQARSARDAQRRLDELSRDIDEATPRASDFVDDGDRAGMRADAPKQRRVRGAAGELSRRFSTGPDGTPLSSDAQRAVEEAAQHMEEAEHALSRGDPREAARAQDEAARRLAELREQLEHDRSPASGGGGGGSGNGGEGNGDDGLALHEPVHIPGAQDFAGPEARRRQVLDAMREGTPAGWEDAVRRYYEGLLR